jgi:hypothetical protein
MCTTLGSLAINWEDCMAATDIFKFTPVFFLCGRAGCNWRYVMHLVVLWVVVCVLGWINWLRLCFYVVLTSIYSSCFCAVALMEVGYGPDRAETYRQQRLERRQKLNAARRWSQPRRWSGQSREFNALICLCCMLCRVYLFLSFVWFSYADVSQGQRIGFTLDFNRQSTQNPSLGYIVWFIS